MVKGSLNSSTPLPVNKYNIKFTITDGIDPLSDVQVIVSDGINEFTGKTGSAGGCTISNIPEGQYNILASKSEYNDYIGTLNVSKNDNLTITMTKE